MRQVTTDIRTGNTIACVLRLPVAIFSIALSRAAVVRITSQPWGALGQARTKATQRPSATSRKAAYLVKVYTDTAIQTAKVKKSMKVSVKVKRRPLR